MKSMNKICFLFALLAIFCLSGCTTNYINYSNAGQSTVTQEDISSGPGGSVAAQRKNWEVFIKFTGKWEPVACIYDFDVRVRHLPDGILIIDNGYNYPDRRHKLIFYNNPGFNRTLPVKVRRSNVFGNFEKETIYGGR